MPRAQRRDCGELPGLREVTYRRRFLVRSILPELTVRELATAGGGNREADCQERDEQRKTPRCRMHGIFRRAKGRGRPLTVPVTASVPHPHRVSDPIPSWRASPHSLDRRSPLREAPSESPCRRAPCCNAWPSACGRSVQCTRQHSEVDPAPCTHRRLRSGQRYSGALAGPRESRIRHFSRRRP